MVSDIDDNFLDQESASNESDSNLDESYDNNALKAISLAEKSAQEQAQKNLLARKRIDELKEKKRLKDLLDDSEDW
ncbi:PA3496 family putative envelope integrity protein [Colwellia piezophila]|uniref:PA3496 family putative envelope integrity protein n=1 Tax=Colwellia piezophila TaxID=211668 RepID=UPI000376D3AC|nr:hypothetical protein [Colwellia piezophila]